MTNPLVFTAKEEGDCDFAGQNSRSTGPWQAAVRFCCGIGLLERCLLPFGNWWPDFVRRAANGNGAFVSRLSRAIGRAMCFRSFLWSLFEKTGKELAQVEKDCSDRKNPPT